MDIDQPLYWHQGLFLQPQHLQHNDRLHAHRLGRLGNLVMPHAWGVVSLQINEAALAAGQFALVQLSLRLRDGTHVEFPGNALIQPRGFSSGDLSAGARTVYVGLRRFVPEQANAAVFENLDAAANASTRFAAQADPVSVPDYLDGERHARVRGLHYVLRLFWEEEVESLAQYDLVPIARIERDGDTVRLAPGYVPPCPNIGASPVLTQMLRDIRDEVIGRARQMEVYKRPHEVVQSEFDFNQMRLLLALGVLNRFGPVICHCLENPQVHPWHIYGLLRQLVGELSWFSLRCDMLGHTPDGQVLVPSYRHDDIGTQVSALAKLIGQLMNEITFGPEQMVRFAESEGMWQAELPDSFLAVRNRYFLVAYGAADAGQLGETLPRDAKLGAPKEMSELINRSLPGIELLYLQVPPSGMPRRAGAVYFRVEQMSDAWMSAAREKAVTLFFPNAPAQFAAELVAVRR